VAESRYQCQPLLRQRWRGLLTLWLLVLVRSPSSSGLGHRPFKAAARVRTPLGTQDQMVSDKARYRRQPVSVSSDPRQGRAWDARAPASAAFGRAPDQPTLLGQRRGYERWRTCLSRAWILSSTARRFGALQGLPTCPRPPSTCDPSRWPTLPIMGTELLAAGRTARRVGRHHTFHGLRHRFVAIMVAPAVTFARSSNGLGTTALRSP
jgi:hypothetical protein